MPKIKSPEVQAAVDAAIAAEKKLAAKMHKSLLRTHLVTVKNAIAEKIAAAKAAGDKTGAATLRELSTGLSELLKSNHEETFPSTQE